MLHIFSETFVEWPGSCREKGIEALGWVDKDLLAPTPVFIFCSFFCFIFFLQQLPQPPFPPTFKASFSFSNKTSNAHLGASLVHEPCWWCWWWCDASWLLLSFSSNEEVCGFPVSFESILFSVVWIQMGQREVKPMVDRCQIQVRPPGILAKLDGWQT